MSSKSAIRLVVPQDAQSSLFKWVAVLTGSKNALKGVGFFLGSALLSSVGFINSLWIMAGGLALIMFSGLILLAFTSIPAGLFAVKIGNNKATLIGLITTAILLLSSSFVVNKIIIILVSLLMIASYSLVANGIVPIAFSLFPSQKSGLGIGVYFGAFSLAMSGYDFIIKKLGTVDLIINYRLGMMAFLITTFLVLFLPKLTIPKITE